MNIHQLDKLHQPRVESLAARWDDGDTVDVNDIFVSERVIGSLDEQKALIESFKLDEILSLAPFTQHLYVAICPCCITPENIENFSKLTRSGLIVPLLVSPYKFYPDEVVSVLQGLDHISFYEFSFYRYMSLIDSTDELLCSHCVDNYDEELKAIVKGKRGAPEYREKLDDVLSNLHPFMSPDFELLNDIKSAFESLNQEHVSQLTDLSYTIQGARTAQAFNAALIQRENKIIKLPEGITEETDHAREASLQLSELVTEGLGLTIPTDIPIDAYIELVHDFRPKIIGVTGGMLDSARSDTDELSVKSLLRSINDINREIERIKGLKRHMLLEAMVGFTNNNRAFTVSALVAGAMGLGGSLVGCAGIAAGIGADMAKKAGKLRGSKSMDRFGRKLHRDLTPGIDTLIAKYVGSQDIPMHVLSIRKQIASKKG